MVNQVEPIVVRGIILTCSYSPSGILRQVSEKGGFKQVRLPDDEMKTSTVTVWHILQRLR